MMMGKTGRFGRGANSFFCERMVIKVERNTERKEIGDLHIHSYFSDGTMSPEEIAGEAERKGVRLLAIADHNMLDGARELADLCKNRKIRNITAVELDSLDGETDVHLLGYGVDLYDPEFCAFVRNNRRLLDQISVNLIRKMQKDYPCVSSDDYEAYRYDRRGGGWKALHYLRDRGLSQSLTGGLPFYGRYGCSYDTVAFPAVRKAAEQIHRAGGRAVLAHPGVVFDPSDISGFEKSVRRMLGMGLDGIECYYPKHPPQVTGLLLKICREGDRMITAGSDCHGRFGSSGIGQTNTPVGCLRLAGLAD